MSLAHEAVSRAYRVLAGRFHSMSDAERMAQLLGSREELLACLIARDKVFEESPELSAALSEVARSSYSAPASPRKEVADAITQREASLKLEQALHQLMAAERGLMPVQRAVHEAFQGKVRHWQDQLTHPGYHWYVSNEPT